MLRTRLVFVQLLGHLCAEMLLSAEASSLLPEMGPELALWAAGPTRARIGLEELRSGGTPPLPPPNATMTNRGGGGGGRAWPSNLKFVPGAAYLSAQLYFCFSFAEAPSRRENSHHGHMFLSFDAEAKGGRFGGGPLPFSCAWAQRG